MWSERQLSGRIFAIDQKLMQYAKSHAALGSWTLINRRSDSSRSDFRNQLGKQVRGDDRKTIEHLHVTCSSEDGDRGFRCYINSSKIGMFAKKCTGLFVCLGINPMILNWVFDDYLGVERLQRTFKCTI